MDYSYELSNGRTLIQDLFYSLDRGVEGAESMEALWEGLKGKEGIDDTYHEYARSHFAWYSEETDEQRSEVYSEISDVSG